MISVEVLQDIITDHNLCGVQKRELLKTIAMIKQGRLIEQKHGTWNYINGGIINPHFRCSICYAPRFEHYAANDFNFCPACGAKMVSEVKLKELEE